MIAAAVAAVSVGSGDVAACTAAAGYRGEPGETAVPCSSNTYCPAGATAITPCPPNTEAPPRSVSAADCTATAGFFGPPGTAARDCPQVPLCLSAPSKP
jgi:hypothetical protein